MSVLPGAARPVRVALPVIPQGSCRCEVTVPHDGIVLVRILGEVDIESIGQVEDAVGIALSSEPGYVVVDLAGMAFCGLQGLALLVAARTAAIGLGIGFSVCAASTQAVRVWSAMWDPAELPTLHVHAAAGLRAACSAREAAVQHRVAELPARVDVPEQGLGVG